MSALLGIDLGTSSVKLVLHKTGSATQKSRAEYSSVSPEGWLSALRNAAQQLDLSGVDAIGLSSQVGTYIIDGKHVVPWNGSEGLNELTRLKSEFSKDEFINHIGMAHPDMVSYPLPRLMYFADAYPNFHEVCMPKELLLKYLTGNYVSDMYSWRGLADLDHCAYSAFFTEYLHKTIGDFALPDLIRPTDLAGRTTHEAAAALGLREGVPVFTGCNDFFAALLGSGIRRSGDRFDITGTSEHLGGISDELLDEANLISGRYFSGFVRYGVTASSGPSLDYGLSLYSGSIEPTLSLRDESPIFLPYVNGERCPVCDPSARGVMFGVNAGCSLEQMAWAVLEGVCFNLKLISEKLCMPASPIITCGGAAKNPLLNQLKADILNMPIHVIDESDASALGAAYIAGIGCGEFSSMDSLPRPRVVGEYSPSASYDYSRRFETFKSLYPALKDSFQQLGRK